MKIGKLTWLYNGNYGSVFQAYALQKVLKDNGYDIEDINYKASLKTKLINWIYSHNSISLFWGKYKEMKGKKNKQYLEKFKSKNKKFEDFKNKYMSLSKLCVNPQQLKEISKEYDLFICGSDQIWSPALLNPVFYFSFLNNGEKRISYATSFGVTSLTKWKKNKIAKLLNEFNKISIREKQGQKMIKDIINKDVPVVVDPTMLLDKEQWNECVDSKRKKDGKYIFCYLLSSNDLYVNAIKEFAHKKNLNVVIIPNSKGPFNTGFEEMIDIGPDEWLNLLINSEYVFTDSFHGTIFSMIYHKNFILFERFLNTNKKSENSRIYTLMEMVNLKDRIISKNNIDDIYSLNNIDYSYVSDIISFKAKWSKNWLVEAIEESVKKNEK